MIEKVINNYIKNIWKDSERKPLYQICTEFFKFSVVKKTLSITYFTRLLYKKDRTNYLDYTTNTMVETLQKHFNDSNFTPVLQNKYLYHLFFKEHKLPIPNTIAYNIRNIFFLGKERHIINNEVDFIELLYKMYKKCEDHKVLFIKEIAGAWGKGAHKISLENLEKGLVDTTLLYEDIVSADFIFQEAIIQHETISKLYPLSINSIRIDTFVNQNGKAEILSALLRMGGNGNFVDNVTAGGLFVGIDLKSGKLDKYASVFLKNGAKSYLKHPDTNTIFENYEIPFFEEAKELALKAAESLPALRLIGWDIIITQNGALLLEGNHLYHIGMSEMAYGGYYRNPVFKRVLKEAGMISSES
ncbi:sugar-transfer associated ATP-grasp domain-containing protein [Hydrogenimonas sp.]